MIPSARTPRSVLPSQRDGHHRGNSTYGEHGSEGWVAGWRLPKVKAFLFLISRSLTVSYRLIFHLFLGLQWKQNYDRRLEEGWGFWRVEEEWGQALPPLLSDAGVALSVNGLRLRHVTQQQLPSINTASSGKWWQDSLRGRQREKRSRNKGIVTAVEAWRHPDISRALRNDGAEAINSECA